MRRSFGFLLAAILIAIVGVLSAASWYMLDYSLMSSMRHSHQLEPRLAEMRRGYPQIRPWVDSLQDAGALRDTFVLMPTGERHHAVYVRVAQPSNKVAVLIHGYKDNCMGMMHIGYVYSRLGFNLLLPDLHAHGKSEGADIRMGWEDRKDVMRWMAVADSLFRDSTATSRMMVHGISMGAATAMCISGEELPPYVRGFVEDCGYTSVWEEFRGEMRARFGLPAFPLLHAASVLCKLRFGWSFQEASPLRQVGRCKLPMLFIHGDADTYVPFSMLEPLYEAKPGIKERYVASKSAHALSYRDHPREYAGRVAAFVRKCGIP
ncbi:hypothetical protein C7120_04615 [Prevotella sp. oral taxon 376]|uniref:alpha/beta hydrolase n=1 Tax=Prevotella sp. oral taxon 376 TaxID=712466 RepID=UPI000D1D9217|nr:alpha/beta hydrolase [Prevotella sp. oral taxon 376]PTL33876.1 hypothetical protein C7120_04615 [Prevotella sp. oral taxon 376]